MVRLLAELGVTRVSLGAQSFRQAKLQLLERDHTGEQVEQAAHLARQHGMAVAIDMIFATPGESLAEWEADLERAIALQPEHFSVYGLTFEKGTTFWNRLKQGGLTEVDDETQRAMYEHAIDRLAEGGWEHYEVSNFARPGCRSRHNETYWRGRRVLRCRARGRPVRRWGTRDEPPQHHNLLASRPGRRITRCRSRETRRPIQGKRTAHLRTPPTRRGDPLRLFWPLRNGKSTI